MWSLALAARRFAANSSLLNCMRFTTFHFEEGSFSLLVKENVLYTS